MDAAFFERLLHEEESTMLDFKKEQYPFAKATDEEKSELLKDILGFANAWRRSDAYILIGVEEVRGGRSKVIGITNHLDDHALQQFVNCRTNRPIHFSYEALGIASKQVGIIRIEQQTRPIYLQKGYGKLKQEEVYVRRGSSTNHQKPASLEEIAQMGSAAHSADMRKASLAVEFAALDREETLGDQIEWSAEFCEMPDSNGIPVLDDTPVPIRLPGGDTVHIPSVSSIDTRNRLNTHFYHEFAKYEFFRRLARKVRLVIANKGEVPATDVRLEMLVLSGEGIGVIADSETPVSPERRKSFLGTTGMDNLRLRPAFRHAGYVDIDRSERQTKVEIDCGNLQPGRRVWTDAFCMGIGRSGEVKLTGCIYAANLFHPQEFTLSINATIQRTSMTVDELLALSEKGRDNDDSEDDDIDC